MSINKQSSRQYINEGIKGWKRYLPLMNIILFLGVITLGVVGVVLFHAVPSPFTGLERLKTKIQPQQVSEPTIQTNSALKEDYDLLANENPFAPGRKEWVPPKPKVSPEARKKIMINAATKVPPKKIDLYGVAIFENMKKALVKNPDPGKYGAAPFFYVEEGNEIGGYNVKSIEPQLIRLVWEGQEFAVNIFEDKGGVRTFPPPPGMQPYTPPPQSPASRRRPPRDTGFPQGMPKQAEGEDWGEDWDNDENWDDDEAWDDEEWDEDGDEEYYDEDYERKGEKSKSRQSQRRPRRPRRR